MVTSGCGAKQEQSGRTKMMRFGTPRHGSGVSNPDLQPVFHWLRPEGARNNEDNRRRSIGMDGGGNRFLGGSDPTLSGMEAAQRLRRRGSLPPKLSSRFPRSVAGRVVGRKPDQFESLTVEEMKRWP